MTFTKLNKLNAEVAEEYEALQATKQKVFASIHARHEELHEAMESLRKTNEELQDVMEPFSETNVVERNDIDDEIDFISRELDELLESMNN